MSVAFVTNFCPHYRVRTFELLAERLGAEFLFFSRGTEWYWPASLQVRSGAFPHRYLSGFDLAGTRVTPGLAWPLLSRRHDAVIKCINGRFALPVTYFAARARRRPFILWTGVWHRLRGGRHRLLLPFVRHIYRHADAIVAYGSHVREFLMGEGAPADRIFVAPHATDAALYGRSVTENEVSALRGSLGLEPGTRVLLHLGRLETAKGVHVLLDAFLEARLRDAVLLYVGSGAERDALQRRAREVGSEAVVRISPTVPPEQVPAFHAMATALVLASVTTPRFKEPWGLVVNEAFHQGTPAITSNAVGAAAGGLVRHGETGLVVPEGDTPALANALRSLVANPRLRRRLGKAARDRVVEWSNERMVQGFSDAVETARRRGGE